MLLLWPLIALSSPHQNAELPLADLRRLAKAHDAVGLRRYLASPSGPNPFAAIATPGAYVPGPKDWSVFPLQLPGEAKPKFVVFSSIVIVEDLGDLVFAVGDDGKLTFVDERKTLGDTIERHRFDVRFDLKQGVAHMIDKVRLSRSGSGPVLMRIGDQYHVTRVLDGAGGRLGFAQGGGTVEVQATGKPSQELTLEYEGNPESKFMAHPISDREATLAASVWYPMIGRRPTPYDLTVHMPKDWLAVGQGEQVGSTVQGDERTVKYRMDLPAVWLSLSAGPFKQVVSKIGGREYATVSASMTAKEMELQNRLSSEPIDFYSRNFAPYPFHRWTNLDSWVFGSNGGALEAYSYATYPNGAMPGVDGHETGHSWWGGMLNNDYLTSFWNESFAEYSSWLFLRERVGSNREEARRAFTFNTASDFAFEGAPLSEAGDAAGPIAAILGYVKGPMVLDVLEDEIGTPAMIRSMREWSLSNPPRHIARWAEFEAAVDRVTGKNYRWFFDQWVRRSGLPKFTATTATWSKGRVSGSLVFEGKPYRFHVEALLRLADGHTQVERVEILPDASGEARYSFDCPKLPYSLTLNPWQTIPRIGSISDAPLTLSNFIASAKVVRLAGSNVQIPRLQKGEPATQLPADLEGKLFLGTPESLQPLLKKAGVTVKGSQLLYDGKPVDLTHGGLLALIELPGGKHCAIGLGTALTMPPLGKAQFAVFDEVGHLLRGRTAPVKGGALTVVVRHPSWPHHGSF